jgi:hypothetical protein
MIRQKRCTKCKVLKDATEEFFPPMKVGKMGLHPHCRECHRKYARDYAARRWQQTKRRR